MSNLPVKKVSIVYLVLIVVISSAATFIVTKKAISKSSAELSSNQSIPSENCGYRVKRLNGHNLIKPILYIESSCESENLQLLKQEVNNTILNYSADGTLTSASVYVRNFINSEWFCLNGSERYSPGSMLKVPILIAFLKMDEKTPGVLDKQLLFDKKYTSERKAVNVSESIKIGQKYTVRELLRYMIQYSDNDATFLLNRNMDVATFNKVFSDFGLSVPDSRSSIYQMSVTEYSNFMRALFNGSYLDPNNSEYAVELLTKSDYKNGIVQGLPNGVEVAHKFGEEGNVNNQELHESGIVYLENSPYLITIMTKGKDLSKQSKVLGEISAKVFQSLSTR
ncbi:MAG: serine hydrolase [Bacteroidales bacterium]|nr:serine hydrolase [Bacteroidales bacterium]